MDYTHNDSANSATESIPWSEIFARHEAVLCSHMEMLNMVKGQIAPGVDAFQTVVSMVNKTVQAMNQLKVARKQMMNSKFRKLPRTPSNPSPQPAHPTSIGKRKAHNMSDLESSGTSSSSASSNAPQTDTEANTRKKRRRVSREKAPVHTEPDSAAEVRSSKRSRDNFTQPPVAEGNTDGDVTSTSLGTEDISAEVQRRLKIKEEQRRRRNAPKQDKRKRDSLASNDGASPSGAMEPRKKRAKTENDSKRDGDLETRDTSRKKLRRVR